jgi:predicted RNA-binding Zn-ribbon protein involved in translation (DUF1610 family)
MKTFLTIDTVMFAVESGDSVGFCVACGAEAYGVEPDARKYKCESCGQAKVYGAEELLMLLDTRRVLRGILT